MDIMINNLYINTEKYKNVLFVALDCNNLIGRVELVIDTYYSAAIINLWIKEEYRNIGIGKKLILSCEEYSKKLGLDVRLSATGNKLKEYYTNLGYEVYGTDSTENEYKFLMKKQL
jgi:ribosomal protein S18 acetylase RimI-like enzyme